MAQGAIDGWFGNRRPSRTKGGSPDISPLATSLVLSDPHGEESGIITDAGLSLLQTSPQDISNHNTPLAEKVNPQNICWTLGPEKKLNELQLADEAHHQEEAFRTTGTHFDNPIITLEELDPPASEPVFITTSSPVKKTKSGISALDILTGTRKKKSIEVKPETPVLDDETVRCAEPQSDTQNTESPISGIGDKVIFLASDPEDEPSSKISYSARDLLTGLSKRTSVVEILSEDEGSISKKERRKKDSKKKKKNAKVFFVTFKYKTRQQKIKELEEKIRNSSAKATSSNDFFVKRKTRHADGGKQENQNIFPLLANQNIIRKNPISKLKELHPPPLTQYLIHVMYPIPTTPCRQLTLRPRKHLDLEEIQLGTLPEIKSPTEGDLQLRFKFTDFDLSQSKLEISARKIPKISKFSYYNRFVNIFNGRSHINDMWTIAYRPLNSDDILADSTMVCSMKTWLSNSFKILKKTTKRPDFKKKKKDTSDDIDDFVVENDSDATEDEEYVPLMIIHGPHGVGKTSAVYALVEELNGYVYEINASQRRSRKDIMSNLKELSTTQLVHQNDGNEFKKGVILFEDVDILLENDRGFWSVVENLMNISRRPIIISCANLSAVPSNFVDLAAVFEYRRQTMKTLRAYLFLVGLVENVCIRDDVIEQVLHDRNMDLRASLNQLEFLCKREQGGGLKRLKSVKEKKTRMTIDEIKDVEGFAGFVDGLSLSNVIEANQHTLLNFALPVAECLLENEEAHVIEETSVPPPDYFEFNYSQEMYAQLPSFKYKIDFTRLDTIIHYDREFVSLKLNESTRNTRSRALLGAQIRQFATDTYPDEVFDILPGSQYIQDVNPVIREFARYDLRIKEYNEVMIESHPEHTVQDLIREGLLLRTKFGSDPRSILYDPTKSWEIGEEATQAKMIA